jgi:hypothetical protein
MKRIVLIFVATALFASLQAQRDSIMATGVIAGGEVVKTMADNSGLKIFPVPVKENNFTITADEEITLVKVTNIIGQEIYRTKYSVPLLSTRVFLNNPQRGMYLITVIFSDNSRIVRKIMVEGA